MSIITMSADSTSLILNGQAILDFAEGDIIELTPVNPLTSQVNGAGDAVSINKRVDSGVHDLTVRVQRMSQSDVFLSSSVNQEAPTVFNGSLKEDYSIDGQEGLETYLLENGSITTLPTNTKNNTEGSGMMEYVIRFRKATRSI